MQGWAKPPFNLAYNRCGAPASAVFVPALSSRGKLQGSTHRAARTSRVKVLVKASYDDHRVSYEPSLRQFSTYGVPGVQTVPFRSPSVLPIYPTKPDEVLVPGQIKTIHLYEGRYLALLEAVLMSNSNLFAHAVCEPAWTWARTSPGALAGPSYTLCMASLVKVLSVQRQHVGALVTVRGEGRLHVHEVQQELPFMRGTVSLLTDKPVSDPDTVAALAEHLDNYLQDVIQLGERLEDFDTTEELRRALQWVNGPRDVSVSAGDEGTEQAARLAYAALQDLPLGSEPEREELVRQRICAMADLDTTARLRQALDLVSAARARLIACASLHTLFLA